HDRRNHLCRCLGAEEPRRAGRLSRRQDFLRRLLDPPAAVADLIMNVAGREHRFAAFTELGLVQAPLNATLAVVQLLSYLSVHSKSLLASGVRESSTLS